MGILFLGITAAGAQSGGGHGGALAGAKGAEKAPASLSPVVTEYGHVTLSVDGVGMAGTITSTGVLQVEKPREASVRGAYLAVASAGLQPYQIPDGEIQLGGSGVTWTDVVTSSVESYNHWADVTAIVQPIVDAAPAGLIELVVTEPQSLLVDGAILAVIFNDQGVVTNSTVSLLFGAQNIAGETFAIRLAEPADLDDPELTFDMSLGISFGCQGSPVCAGGPNAQYSQIEVNDNRMSTAAGGQDDGQLNDGVLFTVGGLGDSNDNPADPLALPQDTRDDDELYSLI
ncbi:MAG: hypothetical protein ACRDIB_10795, partial [Ardenticatenaceae bacterium]